MKCPRCDSKNVEYIKPEIWNMLTIKKDEFSKKGGYTCLDCNKYFSFKKGVLQK